MMLINKHSITYLAPDPSSGAVFECLPSVCEEWGTYVYTLNQNALTINERCVCVCVLCVCVCVCVCVLMSVFVVVCEIYVCEHYSEVVCVCVCVCVRECE